MVGHLHLQAMGDTREQSRDGLLDSPDSGLPPSPSPSPPFYALSPGTLDTRATTEVPAATSLFPNPRALEMRSRLLPVFFGESIKVDPEPAHEIRCNSEVTYASERYFRDKIFYVPVPTVTAYSETIVAAPNCTWRSYRSQLTLEPRPRALHFGSTAIIFPKLARSSFRTTLHCSLGQPRHWYSSSLQLRRCGDPAPSSGCPDVL